MTGDRFIILRTELFPYLLTSLTFLTLDIVQTSLTLLSLTRKVVCFERLVFFVGEILGRVYHVQPVVGLTSLLKCYMQLADKVLAALPV